MKPELLKTFPLLILKDIHNLIKAFEDLYKKNSDIIIRLEKDDENILHFKNYENTEYSFTIFNPQIHKNKVSYQFSLTPSNEAHFSGYGASGELDSVINWFHSWIFIMRELSKYQNILSEPFLNEYTEEFFAEFEFVEEEDDNNPYETKKQIALYNALEKLELTLKHQEQTESVKEIIQETIDLKENIQNISKGAIKQRVAKIFARIKKGGIKLLKDVIEIGYKEIIKAALESGVDKIGQLLP